MAAKRRKSHPTWGADPHLRKGWLCAIPVFGLGLAIGFAAFGAAMVRRPILVETYGLFVAFAVNVVWFGVAAWSRARSA